MTFLVNEKDIEIAEVRSSLQKHEVNQQQMAEKLQLKEERVDELENELEHASKNMLEARTGQQEAEAKIEELKAIIKQQESEIISMNETIESGKHKARFKAKSSVQELCSYRMSCKIWNINFLRLRASWNLPKIVATKQRLTGKS